MTAVEFLHSEYMKIFGELNPSTGKLVEIAYALEQAKEIEKEQSHKYAEFSIRCDRMGMKILNFQDCIKLENFKSE